MRYQEIQLAEAPCLMSFGSDAQSAASRGTILLYHGLGVDKESLVVEQQRLTEAGFLVVSVDAIGHGARRSADFSLHMSPERAAKEPLAVEAEFGKIISQTALEVPAIIDELSVRGWAETGKLGIGGISMGGCITYAALVVEPRLRTAVAMLASPPLRGDLHPQIEKFLPVALLSQIAMEDQVVSPQGARHLHERLSPLYEQVPERLHLIEFAEVGHYLSVEVWERMRQGLVSWFIRFSGKQESP